MRNGVSKMSKMTKMKAEISNGGEINWREIRLFETGNDGAGFLPKAGADRPWPASPQRRSFVPPTLLLLLPNTHSAHTYILPPFMTTTITRPPLHSEFVAQLML